MLISCIMPTRGRQDFVKQAVQYWREQTIESELVIVDDLDNRSFPNGIEGPRITYHLLDRNFTIGSKRNMACEFATGTYIAHWDSDDFYAPGRLQDQLETIQACGKAVIGYRSSKCTDGQRWWRFAGHSHNCLGSSLFYTREYWKLHKFANKQIGEDVAFEHQANQDREFYSKPDADDLMVFRIHADNTSVKNPGATSQYTALVVSERTQPPTMVI